MKKKLIFLAAVAIVLGALSGCATNKKKKCNTCPKWTSEVVDLEGHLRG